MSEKEKRKENPNRSSRRFTRLIILMTLILLAAIFGMVSYIQDENHKTLEEIYLTATALEPLWLNAPDTPQAVSSEQGR